MSLLASRKILLSFSVLIGISYPFLVYVGMNTVSPGMVLLGIVFLLVLRLLILKSTLSARLLTLKSTVGPLQIWPLVIAIVVMAACAIFFSSEIAVQIYPIVISFCFGSVFLWSILFPPTIIEIIARFREPDIGARGISYTRKVTLVWVLFFAFNGSMAAWTVFYGTLEQWTLYNGFISYCLIGTLFGAEFLTRKWVKSREIL